MPSRGIAPPVKRALINHAYAILPYRIPHKPNHHVRIPPITPAMPSLYIIATPIGNLEDITLRALRLLNEVALIAAEDTRVTRRLLSRYDIHTPLTSFNEHNQAAKIPMLIAALADADVALVSDAGTPGVNDPAQALALAAHKAGCAVVPVPGASAVTAAVAVSGLAADGFVYLGFLPRKRGERVNLLKSLAHQRRALVAFESPRRLRQSLPDMLDALGDRRIAVCREMTKLHEEIFHGNIADALAHFREPKGEFTLVVEGAADRRIDAAAAEVEAANMLDVLRRSGVRAKEAVGEVADATGLPRRRVYQLWLADDNAAPSDNDA